MATTHLLLHLLHFPLHATQQQWQHWSVAARDRHSVFHHNTQSKFEPSRCSHQTPRHNQHARNSHMCNERGAVAAAAICLDCVGAPRDTDHCTVTPDASGPPSFDAAGGPIEEYLTDRGVPDAAAAFVAVGAHAASVMDGVGSCPTLQWLFLASRSSRWWRHGDRASRQ